MRYQAFYAVFFDAPSDDEACSVAGTHHRQMHDLLQVEGADHPYGIKLERVVTDGRDVLATVRDKAI